MRRNKIGLAALQVVLCTWGSIGFGYAYVGPLVFDRHLTYFQFVAFGLVAGVFVAAWPLLRPAWLALLAVVAFLALTITAQSDTPARHVRDAVGVLSLIGAVKVSLLNNRIFRTLAVGKFVVWAAVFAITHVCAVLVLSVLLSVPIGPGLLPNVARIGALIGAGVGFGYELAVVIGGRRRFPAKRRKGARS